MRLQPFALGFLFTLAACGGSSTAPPILRPGPVTPAPTPTPPAAAGATGMARITITIPLAAASAHRAKTQSYISAKTKSVGVFVTAVNGVPPKPAVGASANVGGASPGCTAGAGGIMCTLSFTVPSGNDTLSVRTYPQPDAAGVPLSIGTATTSVVANQSIDVAVNLLPVVYTVSSTSSPASLPIGAAGTITLTVTGSDSAGDVIGGTDAYYLPITVTSSDTSGHVTSTPALPAKITAPGQTIAFAYDGKGTAASYLFTVAAQGDAIVTQTSAPYTAAFSFVGGQHLYVTSGNSVLVYDIQSDGSLTGPSRTLAGSATTIAQPNAIAVDKLGTLYVANYHRDITVFAAGAGGNVAPTSTFGAGTYPESIASNGSTGIGVIGAHPKTDGGTGFDQSLQTLYLVDIYPNGNPPGAPIVPNIPLIINSASSFATSPLPDVSGAYSALACFGVTPLYSSNSINCYNGALGSMTRGGNSYPSSPSFGFPEVPGGIAFRPDGNLTVASDAAYMKPPAINTYAMPNGVPSSPQAVPQLYSLSGSNVGLMYPTGIAFDKLGNLYVSDYGQASFNGTVKQWPMNANGNVAPARVLSGLNGNYSIAIGP